MSYKARTLFRLVDEINDSLFLPHIQRPFVWEIEQMSRLFDSLMRDYPIQTFLFWRTKDAIKARRFMPIIEWDTDLHKLYEETKSQADVEKVFVLDGQQRLQTMFALFNGAVKSEDDKTTLEAYCDITSGGTIDEEGYMHRLTFSPAPLPLPAFRLRDLLGKYAQKNADDVAEATNDALDKTLADSGDERSQRQRRVRRNCSQLLSLLREEKHFWVEELDGVANEYPYKKILDIFVRVNSGGTKLDAADLMFAAMKQEWSEVEEEIEDVVNLLNENQFDFDKTMVLKCILTALGRGAELSPNKFTSQSGQTLLDDIKNHWPQIESAFNEMRDFIVHELHLFGGKVIRSYNSFVPLFDYLYHNPKPRELDRNLMRGYYYKSQLFNWYGARTDGIINAMHNLVGKALPSGFPMTDIKDYFIKSRQAEVELKRDTLLKMQLRFIILNLVYVDQFGTSPFNVRFKGNEPHIDHIFPQSRLRKDLKLTTVEINSIGNYRFVGATDNIRKRAELPANYFKRLMDNGIPIGKHLLLPAESANPGLLVFDVSTYQQFREKRLDAICEICKRVVNPELP